MTQDKCDKVLQGGGGGTWEGGKEGGMVREDVLCFTLFF